MKKQYDGYVSFFSKKLCKIVTYCGSFFFGHCTADGQVDHFYVMGKVLVRIIEQYQNLKEYILKALPMLPGFKGKNIVNQTERYQIIKNVLTSKAALAYMSFIVQC